MATSTREQATLRHHLADLGVRCAYQGCERIAVGRDPRPTTVPAFYYLCSEHLEVAERELATPKRPYRVEYTVYVSACVAAASPEDALALARERGGTLAIVSSQREIAELRLVDCEEWPVPEEMTRWTSY